MKEKIKEIFCSVKKFIHSSSKLNLTLFGIAVFLVASAVVILIANSKPKRKNTKPPSVKNFIQTEEYFKPKDLTFTKDYYFYRESNGAWNDEQADEWFSAPDKKTVEELSDSNDKIIDDIIGAAP